MTLKSIESTGTGIPMQVNPVHFEDLGISTSITILEGHPSKLSSLHGIIISTDTAGAYSISIGADSALSFYFPDNGGIASPTMYPFYLQSSINNSDIVLTKPEEANTSITAMVGCA